MNYIPIKIISPRMQKSNTVNPVYSEVTLSETALMKIAEYLSSFLAIRCTKAIRNDSMRQGNEIVGEGEKGTSC
jgi:hypothetical protein